MPILVPVSHIEFDSILDAFEFIHSQAFPSLPIVRRDFEWADDAGESFRYMMRREDDRSNPAIFGLVDMKIRVRGRLAYVGISYGRKD